MHGISDQDKGRRKVILRAAWELDGHQSQDKVQIKTLMAEWIEKGSLSDDQWQGLMEIIYGEGYTE